MADDEAAETSKRIKQLENQNVKFKRLLNTTEHMNTQESAREAQLKTEAVNLTRIIEGLEERKRSLNEQLVEVLVGEKGEVMQTLAQLEEEHRELQAKLRKVLSNVKGETDEIELLKMEDAELKKVLGRLENEKSDLLERLKGLNPEAKTELQEKLSKVEEKKSSIIKLLATKDMKEFKSEENAYSNFKTLEKAYKQYIENLDDAAMQRKLSHLETKNERLVNLVKYSNANVSEQLELSEAIIQSNTNLLHKIKSVKSQFSFAAIHEATLLKLKQEKERLYHEMETLLEKSIGEVEDIKQTINNPEVKHLVNEIEIQKAILLYNLRILKMKEEIDLPDVPIHAIELGDSTPQASTSRDEPQRPLRLERQLQTQSELHNTFMRERSSCEVAPKNQDDATNELFCHQIDSLRQRIVDLEVMKNELRTELDGIGRRDEGEVEVLGEGEEEPEEDVETTTEREDSK